MHILLHFDMACIPEMLIQMKYDVLTWYWYIGKCLPKFSPVWSVNGVIYS